MSNRMIGCWKRTNGIDSTLPFSTRCENIQRWYAAFKTRWFTWSIIPQSTDTMSNLMTLIVQPGTYELARSFPHTLNPVSCRTEKPAQLSELVRGLPLSIDTLETHGGMGRIYALRDPCRVLKIADIRRSWCKYEPDNYKLLETKNIPCAKMHDYYIRTLGNTIYTLVVLERLEFTMTSYIRSAGRLGENPRRISAMLKSVLKMLKNANMAYGDLSPDNIMFRRIDDIVFEIALVDPQFAVPLDAFERALTTCKADNFDTIYLALKVQSIGILDPAVCKYTERICTDILGYVPSEKETKKWLLKEAPVGLFVAYDVIRRINRIRA